MAFADQDEPAECSDGRIVNRVPRRFIRGFEPEVFLDRGETRLIGVRAFADQKRKMKNMSGTREADIRPRVQLMPEVRPAALGGMLWYEIRPF